MRHPPTLAWSLLLPPLLALLAWAPSALARDFAFDDREAIVGNPVVEGGLPASAAFRRDYWHHLGDAGHYRPLATLSLRADHAQFGHWVVGYHLKNVFLHLVVVGGASLAVLALLSRPRPALLGLAVFAAHPALADSVAWISGRTSMLGALGPLFGLLAVGVALRLEGRVAARALALSGAAIGLAAGLLGKEEALVFAPLLPLVAWPRARDVAVAAAVGVAIGLGAYLALRAAALGSPLPSAPYAPLADAPLALRLRYAGRALVEALRLALLPVGFPPNHRAAPGFAPGQPPGAWALLGWALYAAALAAAVLVLLRERGRPGGRARARVAAAAGGLAALAAWLPFTQLVPAGEVFAPRFLYLPLLLASPALGLALLRLPRPLLLLVLTALVPAAWDASQAYADRGAYARAVLAHVPGDVGAWNDLGLALEETGDVDGAVAAWERALALDPRHARSWSNLGRRQLAIGRLDEAEDSLRRAVAHSSRNPVARCNLGALLLRRDDPAGAAAAYAAAAEIAPGMSAAWRGLANARLRSGELAAARVALTRALALDPKDGRTLALAARLERTGADRPAGGPGASTPEASGSAAMREEQR